MILIFVQTLVFVNIIHERPQIVAVRHYSLTFIEASSRTCLSSSPITADYCFRCPLVFIARSSSSPARPYSSPLPLAKTIVFASIVLGSFASDRSRSSRSLAFPARSSLIAVYSSSTSSPTQLHRPFVFIARSPVLVAFTARKGYSLCEYRLSRIVAVRPARSPSPAASSSSPIVVYSLPTLPNFSLSRAFSPPPFKSRDIFSPWNYFPLQCVRCGSLGWTVITPPCGRSVSGRAPVIIRRPSTILSHPSFSSSATRSHIFFTDSLAHFRRSPPIIAVSRHSFFFIAFSPIFLAVRRSLPVYKSLFKACSLRELSRIVATHIPRRSSLFT